MANLTETKMSGLLIDKHCVKDAKSKASASQSLINWQRVALTPREWIGELELGRTIQPSAFEPFDDCKFTHAIDQWRGTHFVCCDADNLRGIEFLSDGSDKNPHGVEPWREETGLSERYPSLTKRAFAVGQSVSSMSEDKPPPHRRYRIIFLFDDQITSEIHCHSILLALSAEYPIIPAVERSPAQPVFGNAREGYNTFSIYGNVLKLSDYPIPEDHPKLTAPRKRAGFSIDKTLDAFLTEHNIDFEPCLKQSGKYFVRCPFTEHHTDAICKPKDAYVFVNLEGAFAFHCSHVSCKFSGRTTWQAFKKGYGIQNVHPQPVARFCSDPIPVPVPVETAEKKEISFPMEAFDGYFYDYLMAYRGNNEVCPAYHFAGLLSVVGATLGRAVFLEGVHPIYPIFYQALIGKTTIARKSTALNLATRLIASVDGDVAMIDNISSAEGLVDIFATDGEDPIDTSGFEGLRGLIYYDELKNLFIKGKQKVTESITTKLTQLYNGEDQLSNNTRQNRTVAKYPTAGLIGCSTYAWLESGISIDDIVGGFANRFVFYLHEQQELIPKVSPAHVNKLESVRERITAIRNEWQGRHQKFIFDDAAQNAHN